MHIRAIAPIHLDPDEVARRQARYDRLTPDGVTLRLDNLPDGSHVPRQLNDADDIRASEAAVHAALSALDAAEVDLAVPDCVLDPAVAARDEVVVAVRGITELAAGATAALGAPFAAVARNPAIAAELDAIVTGYGHPAFTRTHVLDLDFEAIADHDRWNAAVSSLLTELDHTPVRAVLNGCSAVEVLAHPGRAQLVDPTRLALDVLGLARTHRLPLVPERDRG